MLIGGGLGLFLCAREGDEPLLFGLVDDEEAEEEEDVAGEEGLFVACCDEAVLDEVGEALVVFDKLSVVDVPLLLLLLLIRSEMIVLLFTSQLLGEVGGEVEVGDAEAELELATELQLPVFRDKSVGSFSLAAAEAWLW